MEMETIQATKPSEIGSGKRLNTVREATERLRCSRGFLDSEMRSGRIQFRRFGSRIYLTDEDIERYIDQNLVAAKAAA